MLRRFAVVITVLEISGSTIMVPWSFTGKASSLITFVLPPSYLRGNKFQKLAE